MKTQIRHAREENACHIACEVDLRGTPGVEDDEEIAAYILRQRYGGACH